MPAPVAAERVADIAPERQQASIGLVAAARELMLAAALTDLEAGDLLAAQELVGRATALLGGRTRPRVLRPSFAGPAEARDAGEPYPMSVHNPMGLPLVIRFGSPTECRGTVTANALCEGPPESLHGGWSAWLMDCMLGILVQGQGRPAVTGTLAVRYLHRTPLDAPLELGSRIVDRDGRKITVEGWIEHDGQRTVEARGLFVELSPVPE
ncbi:Thioesterase superfamily protein [Blastococcus sp. DSM 46786]|uniref:PaaI family thioesterase n=1 Tax=Blastococcus sp. DSM 46786 TaxID=1798227 RepID=UPI0008D7811B|nr:PaaI family thioesterase [Blastococcus sp. DSM 46786]SEK73288.1 Thioesterase superfamily protein [Blastococcus sp. DSM 46786]